MATLPNLGLLDAFLVGRILNAWLTTLSSRKGFSASFKAFFAPQDVMPHVIFVPGPKSSALWLLKGAGSFLHTSSRCWPLSLYVAFLICQDFSLSRADLICARLTAAHNHFPSFPFWLNLSHQLWVTQPDHYLHEDRVSSESWWFGAGACAR